MLTNESSSIFFCYIVAKMLIVTGGRNQNRTKKCPLALIQIETERSLRDIVKRCTKYKSAINTLLFRRRHYFFYCSAPVTGVVQA